jgi:hypothetical protein
MLRGGVAAPSERVPRDAGTLRKHASFPVDEISLAPWCVNHSPVRSCSWNPLIRKTPRGFDASQPHRVPTPPERGAPALPDGGEAPRPAPPTTREFLRIGCRLTMRFCRRSAGVLTIPTGRCRCVDPRDGCAESCGVAPFAEIPCRFWAFWLLVLHPGRRPLPGARNEREERRSGLTGRAAGSARSAPRPPAARSGRAPRPLRRSSSRPRTPPS